MHILRLIPLFALATLVLSGCGQGATSAATPTIREVPFAHIYQFVVAKSDSLTESHESGSNDNPETMRDILAGSGAKYEVVQTGAQESVTSLVGVIATGSKVWNLYVNGEQRIFLTLDDVRIEPTDRIEWRYEARPRE
mgnify:CR=1 FL=1